MKMTAGRLACPMVAVALLACCGCPGTLPGETTDTGTPAPCTVAENCGEGIACIFPNGSDQLGICDVEETLVSLGTPAPCDGDEDCPEGIDCIFLDGDSLTGFCDVEETQAR